MLLVCKKLPMVRFDGLHPLTMKKTCGTLRARDGVSLVMLVQSAYCNDLCHAAGDGFRPTEVGVESYMDTKLFNNSNRSMQ